MNTTSANNVIAITITATVTLIVNSGVTELIPLGRAVKIKDLKYN